MKVTIITVCYNAEKHIRKTIESVLCQTYCEFQYLIIDGSSVDRTLDVISEFTEDSRIDLYSESDRGISDAFNKGIRYATGEYILFLNSGDFFLNKECLNRVIEVLQNNSYDIVTFSVKSMYREKYPKDEQEGEELWNTSMVPHQGTFIRKEVFAKVGGFSECFKIRMDYDFFCRCRNKSCTFGCAPIEIVYYDADGVSSNSHYLFDKEGVAVRLLNDDEVKADDIRLMEKLSRDNCHICKKINLQSDVCRGDFIKKSVFDKSKTIVIYGAGAAGYRLYMRCKDEKNFENLIVCDSYKSGKYIEEFEREIWSVSKAYKEYNQGIVVISVQDKKNLFEIYGALISVGFAKECIYIYDEDKMEIY